MSENHTITEMEAVLTGLKIAIPIRVRLRELIETANLYDELDKYQILCGLHLSSLTSAA